MCGVAGILQAGHAAGRAELEHTLRRMGDALRHRGPDDAAQWADAAAGIGLAHRRLSILDLSPQGRQPMPSACGRYVASFNGEIYNHAELRSRLAGDGATPGAWRGTSDTEVMLAAISRWGLRRALERFVGMFALALWDRTQRTLFLARDRLGEKPLYYGWCGATLLFASELKALRAHPAWSAQVDRAALARYVRLGHVPAPLSIYQATYKVVPGSVVSIAADRMSTLDRTRPLPAQRYWSVDSQAGAEPEIGPRGRAVDRLEQLLRQSIALQMVADVPVGAFLSGGVDSSTVVALMQSMSTAPVRTFTIGFHEPGYDEAAQARAVARHLGTAHTELYVTPAEAREVILRLPEIYDEPFADSSQIPTFLVSRLARSHVTVSLSGDGGDELFGGYPRYLLARRVWRLMQHMPASLRSAIARLLRKPNDARAGERYSALLDCLPDALSRRMPSVERVLRLAAALCAESPARFHTLFLSHASDPGRFVLDASEPPCSAEQMPAGVDDPMSYWMRLDLAGYLPDDILVKLDRAAMANGLETRIPLLDHRIVEFALRLPLDLKVRDGSTKWLLRQLLHRHVPKRLVERPKMGFGVPIGEWLRGGLKGWADDLLDEQAMRRDGFLDATRVGRLWREHNSRRRNWQYCLWDLLMFQAWLRQVHSQR